MAVYHLTAENFDETIKEGVVLVDFWADWCGPCRMLGPVIESLAAKYEDKHKICKVNIDDAGDLAARFGVMSIPTVILFRNGEVLDKRIGVHPAEEFEDMINKA